MTMLHPQKSIAKTPIFCYNTLILNDLTAQ